MAPKSLLFVASALAGAALVSAQAAPNWIYIPSACSSDCAQTVESAYLCSTQYPNDGSKIYACFCNDYPSDASTCASCLNSNNAAALASLLTSTETACPDALKKCTFECAFDTCASSDVACQCSADYLANIYNCASCNTANGNTGATQISDFNALKESCANQNYTGAAQSFTTSPLPAANTANYVAPTLTATGGGLAATGDTNASGGLAAAGTSGAAGATSAAAESSARSATSGAASRTSGASSAGGASAASAASGSTAASAAASSGSANGLAAPAFGGLLGVAGVIAALL